MQLSTFYDMLLQLFDSLMVANVVFFDVFMVKEASFLPFYVMIFQGSSMCFTPIKTNF
jgi:hypothetical protein